MSGRGPSPHDSPQRSVSTPDSRVACESESCVLAMRCVVGTVCGRASVRSRLSAVCRQLSPTRKHIHEHIYYDETHDNSSVALITTTTFGHSSQEEDWKRIESSTKSTRADATTKAMDRIISPARQTPEQTPYTRPSPTAGRYSGWPAGPSRVQGGAQTGWYPAASHPTWQGPRAARMAEARLAAAVAAKQLASAQLASVQLASA